jgi:hypothetical protein
MPSVYADSLLIHVAPIAVSHRKGAFLGVGPTKLAKVHNIALKTGDSMPATKKAGMALGKLHRAGDEPSTELTHTSTNHPKSGSWPVAIDRFEAWNLASNAGI